MNMPNLYDKRIRKLEEEMRLLKTAHFKTATTIATTTQSANVNFSLYLYSTYEVHSTKRAIITINSVDNTNMLTACYLNLTPTGLDSRYIFVNKLSANNGQARYEILVHSQNQNDWQTLSGGGSVNLTYGIQMVATSNFNYNITYEDVVWP